MSASTPKDSAATFVTVLGWIFICFTALGVVTTLMQNIMVTFVFPDLTKQVPSDSAVAEGGLIVFRIFAAFMFILSAFSLYASWSFLQRRSWARRAFVVFLALGVAWAAFVFLGFGVGVGVFDMFSRFPSSSTDAPPNVAGVFRVMGITFGLFAAGLGVLLVWLIKRLRSPEVRAEFQAA